MIGFFKKILFCFNRKKFWKLVRKQDYINEAFYTNWRENNQRLNKSFKDEVLNDKKWK